MKVNGVGATLLDAHQTRMAHESNRYGTVLNVHSYAPINDEPFVTVSESGSDVLDSARFYVGSMRFEQRKGYWYSLISVESLPLLGKVGEANEQKAKR